MDDLYKEIEKIPSKYCEDKDCEMPADGMKTCTEYGSPRGCLVFYIGVGALPAEKAKAYVDEIKNSLFTQGLERVKPDSLVLFIPTRDSTEVQYIAFN